MNEPLLTVGEVAEIVRVSPKTVMRAIEAGHLEASQLTQGRGGWRIRSDAIDAWLDARSNRIRAPTRLASVRRVEVEMPTPRKPGRAARTGQPGTLIA